MRNTARSAALVCILALIAVAAQADQTFTLKRAPVVGETTKYRLTMIFTLQGQDVIYKSLITDKITNVDKDGSYTVSSTQSEASGSHGERDLAVKPPADETSIATYSPAGVIIDLKGQQSPESCRIANASAFYLPDKPLAIGDSYSVKVAANQTRTTPSATVTYKLTAQEKIGDVNALQFTETYKEDVNANGLDANGKVWVDPASAIVLKVDQDWRNTPLLGTSSFVNGHISYAREP